MSFPLTPASPFVAFTTVITSAFLNAVRVSINEALDGTGGGTYAPGAQIVIGGSGLRADPFSGAVRAGTPSTTIASGSNNQALPQATIYVGSTIGAPTSGTAWIPALGALIAYTGVTSVTLTGCTLVAGPEGGPGLDLATGQAVYFNGALLIDTNAGLAVNGVQMVNGSIILDGSTSNGSLTVQNGGSISVVGGTVEFFASTALELAPGAHMTVGGTSGTPATVEFENYSTCTFDNGSTLTGASGSPGATLAWHGPATFSGATTLSGATTQTALFTRSGTNGRTALRYAVLTSDTALTVDPSSYDAILAQSVGFTADRNWTFSAPAGGICTEVVVNGIAFSGYQGSHNLYIYGVGGSVGGNLLFHYNPAGGGTSTPAGAFMIYYDPTLGDWYPVA
jgi:hypothetical protein